MNFKRYHVSKNLFSIDFTHDDYSTLVYHYTISGLTPNNQYTCSSNFVQSGSSASIWFGGTSTGTNGVSDGNPKTMTSNANGEIDFYINHNTGNAYSQVVNGTAWVMVNEGSTPLSYEPYSSEVWYDIPHYIMGTSTDTLTTLPAVLYPNAVTATVGLKGNTMQSGTPTPDNPIQPSECGERTGNLFDKDTATIYEATIASNGSWTTGNGATVRIPVMPSTTYTLHTNSLQSVFRATEITSDTLPPVGGNLIIRSSNINSYTFTTSENAKYVVFQGAIDTVQQWIQELMLNTGSTPLPYEPYGIKIPISCANTTTPVYLGEVESTRLIKKIIFTGSEDENWSAQAAGGGATRFRYTLANSVQADTAHLTSICTHLPLGVEGGTWNTDNIYTISSNYLWLRFDSSITTVASLKSWLAQQYANGTPVTVWYVLATETTGIVNEPLRKIGDYADEVSGITIPTIAGGDTLSIGTTLQPSEVTVNYKGWHPVQSVHERENGAWT